jgi:transcription elongation factor Elf1
MRERLTGAFGATKVTITPQAKRALTFDVVNCPHCGVHHASLDAVERKNRIAVLCPALGGRPIFVRVTLTPSIKGA